MTAGQRAVIDFLSASVIKQTVSVDDTVRNHSVLKLWYNGDFLLQNKNILEFTGKYIKLCMTIL